MGAVSVVIGGVAGFIFASLLYISGAGLLWTLVGYAIMGNGVVALLMLRYYRNETSWEKSLAREMEAEMEALREYREGKLSEARSPILFRSLRLQEQMSASVSKADRAKLW